MAKLNKSTLKQKESDFINRVAPFDVDPLIQKTEDLELRDDHSDSQVFAIPDIQAINSPAAAFAVDFANGLRADIDTTGSAATTFIITPSNLDDGEKGILNITKKSGDSINIVGCPFLPMERYSPSGQVGLTSIGILLHAVGGSFFAFPMYEQSGYARTDPEKTTNIEYIQLPDWDMLSTDDITISVASYVDDMRKIKSASCLIYSTAYANGIGGNAYPIEGPTINYKDGNIELNGGSLDITLRRTVGGFFHNAIFAPLGESRGVLKIEYTDSITS